MRAAATPLRRHAAALACAALAVLAVACGGGDDEPEAPLPASLRELKSRPDLRPPRISVDAAPERPGSRLVFLSPRMENTDRDGATHQQGALALDERGRTRWFRPAADGAPITDVRVQRYQGRPVLTWWQGSMAELGIGKGRGVIADEAYRPIAFVEAGNGQTVDLHEVLISRRDTALVTIYSRARRDLRPLGGKQNAQVTQGIVQEIDIQTGEVLFEWQSLDHVALDESYQPLPEEEDASWDYFHINSIAEDADGDLLVSARHTSTVYKIDRETGDVVWRLGGKRSDFELGEGVRFGIQHDARWISEDVLQVFDNVEQAKDPAKQEPSSVKRIRLDEKAMTATLEQRFDQPDGMWALSQGNADAQPDGGAMVGWGSTGAFTLFDRRGDVLLDAHLPAEYDSYRAYAQRWVGRPLTRPSIHVGREAEQITVAASWNGATEVQAWQVLAGPSANDLQPVGAPAEWQDLETTIVRATRHPYVAVRALDAEGRSLGVSPAVHAPMPPSEEG